MSEQAGIGSVILFTSLIVEFYNIQEVSIETACDGIEALHDISQEVVMANVSSNSYYLVGAARKYLPGSPLQWSFHHIKGHQDEPKMSLE
jgi:hypothetical protein